MNIYYFFAPVGFALTGIFSFCRVYSWSNRRWVRLLGARLDILVAVLLSIVLCRLIYAESWRGLIELFLAGATDAMSEFAGLGFAMLAPIATAIVYGLALFGFAFCTAKLARRTLHLVSSSRAYDLGAETITRFRVYDGKGAEAREYVILRLGDEVKVLPIGNVPPRSGDSLPINKQKASGSAKAL